MPDILVRNLSRETHASLVRRARGRGQSLQQYMATELTRLASAPTLEDVLARLGQGEGGRVGFAQAVDDLADERSRR